MTLELQRHCLGIPLTSCTLGPETTDESLERHQKEALDFISQRESGVTRDEISLWRLVGEDVPR